MKKVIFTTLNLLKLFIVMHGKSLCFAVMSFMPVTIGIFIYLLFRTEQTLIFGWLSLVGFDAPFYQVRNHTMQIVPFMPEWLIYSFPHGLWTASYSFLISYLWINSKSPIRLLWFATIPLLGFGYEIMQYLEVIPGTFCTIDLLFCFLGILLGLLITMTISIRRGVLLK